MAIWTYTAPANRKTFDAGEVQDFLVSQGLIVEDVSIQPQADGSVIYSINADQDPRTVLPNWQPAGNAQQKARAFLTQTKPAIQDGTATQAQLRNAILALMTLEGI